MAKKTAIQGRLAISIQFNGNALAFYPKTKVAVKGGRFTGMLCALRQLCEFVFKMAFAKLPSRHFWLVFSGKNLASMSRYYNTFSIFENFSLCSLF